MAYYCLHKFHWEPSKYLNLPRKERATVHAMIRERIAQEKNERDKLKSKSKGGVK